MSRSPLINSSVARKVWMGLTGLFLCLFLIGHLGGNLQLLIPGEAGEAQFNLYADFMHHNIFVQIVAKLVFISIILHVIDGLMLTAKNRKARPVKSVRRRSQNSWSSRNMGILGTTILVFIVVHLQNFFWPFYYQRETMPQFQTQQGEMLPNLHEVVLKQFSPENSLGILFVIIYVLGMAAMSFHLWHGFYSGFNSLGFRPHYQKPLVGFGKLFAIVIPVLFAIIPVWLYISQL